MDDLKILFAFLFNKKGDKIREEDVFNVLSFEMGWMTPKEGKKIIEKGLEKNYIKIEENLIKPNFDYKEVEIPLGFKFDESKISEYEKDIFSRIVSRIEKSLNIGNKRIMEEIEEMSKNMEVYPEVAALLYAKKRGIEIDDFVEEIERMIFSKK
ncbi:MAG: DUF2240 family protein [Thermoplasmatales archaeon]|nr:DUF2240 family protein [Thermoplasmatales archaeon]